MSWLDAGSADADGSQGSIPAMDAEPSRSAESQAERNESSLTTSATAPGANEVSASQSGSVNSDVASDFQNVASGAPFQRSDPWRFYNYREGYDAPATRLGGQSVGETVSGAEAGQATSGPQSPSGVAAAATSAPIPY